MTSLVKAVANIVLFILAPVAVVWVQARLAMAIETIGEVPLVKPRRAIFGIGNHEQTMANLSRSRLTHDTAEREWPRGCFCVDCPRARNIGPGIYFPQKLSLFLTE